MKRNIGLWLVLTLLTASAATVAAQQSSDYAMAPPKVLVLMREFIKPGKSGAPHLKTESAFVQAMTAAKWPTHYLGMDSMSGPSRALFAVGYDSFAAWEKDNLATQKNATPSANCSVPTTRVRWPIARTSACVPTLMSRSRATSRSPVLRYARDMTRNGRSWSRCTWKATGKLLRMCTGRHINPCTARTTAACT